MNEEFEIEMPGANEEYQYALELIKNMAGIADDLDPDVFAETMMIYAATYLIANEKNKCLEKLLDPKGTNFLTCPISPLA